MVQCGKISDRFWKNVPLANSNPLGIFTLILYNYMDISAAIVFVAYAILALGPTRTECKHISGVINNHQQNIVFLSRFVFQPDEYGELVYNFVYPKSECCYQLLIFNDDVNQWPYFRKHENTLSCSEKSSLLDGSYKNTVNLSQPTHCRIDTENEQDMFCFGKQTFEHSDERWWYLTIANCNGIGVYALRYNINMTNGRRKLDKHFSADERYILETDAVFLGIYFLIGIALCRFKSEMRRRRLLYVSYQFFSWSCYLQLLSIFMQVVASVEYATNGIGLPKVNVIGQVLSSCSSIIFVLLLILIAKGFTVTRARLMHVTFFNICIFMTCYVIAYAVLYAYRQLMFDPRDVISKYASLGGYGLILLQIFGLLWMYYSCFFTIKTNTDKFNFYLVFLAAFTIWFLAVPLTVWLSNSLIAKWKRAKFVNGFERATLLYGHAFFLTITRPSTDNKYFPFYLKANKVGFTTNDEVEISEQFSSVLIKSPEIKEDDDGRTTVLNPGSIDVLQQNVNDTYKMQTSLVRLECGHYKEMVKTATKPS